MNVHDGHRERLDDKIKKYGHERLEEHEQLEYVLFAVIPRVDTNDLAHRLLRRFGSIAGVFNADVEQLIEIKGVGERTAMFLHTLPSLLGIVERCEKNAPPVLSTVEEVVTFMTTYFHCKLVESAYLLSLNSAYKLIAIDKLSEGSQYHTGLYPSLAVKRAILNNASAAVVVHNHPSGAVNPSKPDVEVSKSLNDAFDAAGIELVDSIIFADGKGFGLKENGYLDKVQMSYYKEPVPDFDLER